MIRVEGQSATREELEAKFVRESASFAAGWSLARDQRVTHWTSPGGTLRVLVEIIPFEYVQPGCVAGFLGEAIQWDELLLRRTGDGWAPAAVHVRALKATKKVKKATLVKKAKARHS
jgi:hypothetical protein